MVGTRRSTALAMLAATGLLALGCGTGDAASSSGAESDSTEDGSAAASLASAPAPAPASAPATAGEASAGADVPEALDFSAPLVRVGGATDSVELDAASFVGQPVAFWFWAPF